MNRTCQCGGIIRESGEPYWDTLPSCSCQNPVMKEPPTIFYSDRTTEL